MTNTDFTIPVQQLAGLKVRRGITPGSWSYPGGCETTYECAVAGLNRCIFNLVTGCRSTGAKVNYCPIR